jgi:hypothetical protein
MASVLPLAIGAATFLALICFWLAWNRLSDWRPATAKRRASDYSEAEQDQDRAMFGLMRNWRWTDSEGARRTRIDVVYADEEGSEHRATVTRYIHRGAILDAYFPVWYQKANPDRASSQGPLSFLLFGLLIGVSVVELFRLMMTGAH